ncbi:MAG TPA: DUF2804 domain-containing protein [Candidatus Nanopelagicales bacterium]|nr:DUF2804 domain-containing protein [Candidatus Nanopelagicales bacterium]
MPVEREITGPVDLCLPDGRLSPDAVGWSRRPLHRTALRGWGRSKRWEYWGVVTPEHILGITVSSLDYAGVHSVYLLERATGSETVADAVVPLGRGAMLAPRCGVGGSRVRTKALRIEIDELREGTRIRVRTPVVDLDVVALIPDGHESLAVVVPWSERLFQYTVKDLGRPLRGRLRVAGATYDVDPASCFGVLDHGRGRWPYAVTWNWGAGVGHAAERAVALQVGGRWTDGTGSTENALFVGGVAHKISENLAWDYDTSDWLAPWRVLGERVDAVFTPFHERASRTDLGVVASEVHQCFGTWSGWASTGTGERVALDGLTGWAEEARNRW